MWATEAQRVARALDLPEVAVDAATLFARLERRAGDPEAARRGLEASIAEARAAGEVGAELRGLFNLGGLQYERGHLVEARETYAAATALAKRAARPWAPYGLDARALGAIVAQVQGDWDGARRIVDVRGESPPAMAEAVLAAVDLFVLAGRGSDRVFALLPHLRPWWERDGLVSILSGERGDGGLRRPRRRRGCSQGPRRRRGHRDRPLAAEVVRRPVPSGVAGSGRTDR